jgi:DNA-binding beta-propeller fold protein YncE
MRRRSVALTRTRGTAGAFVMHPARMTISGEPIVTPRMTGRTQTFGSTSTRPSETTLARPAMPTRRRDRPLCRLATPLALVSLMPARHGDARISCDGRLRISPDPGLLIGVRFACGTPDRQRSEVGDPRSGNNARSRGERGATRGSAGARRAVARCSATARRHRWVSHVAADQRCGRLSDVDAAVDVAVAPDGRHAYVVGFLSETVVAFCRDGRTGRLRQQHGRGFCASARARPGCVVARALRHPAAVSVSRDGRTVYVTENDDGVAVFARERRSGALTQLGGPAGCVEPTPVDGCTPVRGLLGGRTTVAPDDRHVYVASASFDSEAVITLRRSPVHRALTQLDGLNGCVSRLAMFACRRGRGLLNAAAVGVAPDGSSAYAPSRNGSVAIFARSSDGVLSQPGDPNGCITVTLPPRLCTRARALQGANDVVVSPDGRHVYVASMHRGVAIFRRDIATGGLAQLPGRSACVSTPGTAACLPAKGVNPTASKCGSRRAATGSLCTSRRMAVASPCFDAHHAQVRCVRSLPAADASRGRRSSRPASSGGLGAPTFVALTASPRWLSRLTDATHTRHQAIR